MYQSAAVESSRVATTPSSSDTPPGVQDAAVPEITGATTFESLNDLQKKAPKVFNAMMQGIAINIIGEMQDHQTRLKKLWRESRDN